MNAVAFDTLKHRSTLSARLVAQTAFRVGAGRALDAVTTDLPVLRAQNGALLVPGSSLKGVVRSCAEQLLRACAPEGQENRYACDIFGRSCCDLEDQQAALDKLSVAETVVAKRELLAERICKACGTFGAQGWSAVARFTDATAHDALVSVRDGVGMDRDLGRAANHIKYDYEVIDPGAWFNLTISTENEQDWQLGLLLSCLDQIHDGAVRIGGFGSRGLGWFEVQELRVVRRDLTSILRATDGASLDLAALREALNTHLNPARD